MEKYLSLAAELPSRLKGVNSLNDAFAIKAKLDAEWEAMKKSDVRASAAADAVAAAVKTIEDAQKIIDAHKGA